MNGPLDCSAIIFSFSRQFYIVYIFTNNISISSLYDFNIYVNSLIIYPLCPSLGRFSEKIFLEFKIYFHQIARCFIHDIRYKLFKRFK